MDILVTSENQLVFQNKTYPCILGRSGRTMDKSEGDGATPVGRFLLRSLRYRPDRLAAPKTSLPIFALKPDDGWCDDPLHGDYNRPVSLPINASHEKLWRDDALYNVIETVDRIKLARALAREMEQQEKRVECYIQVNTGEEPQKAGILPQDADAFIAECRDELKLPLVGLMCIPPADENPALHFGLLAEMAKRNGLAKLSMGMSGDYQIAVEFGATAVRVGTAIFGARPPFNPAPD